MVNSIAGICTKKIKKIIQWHTRNPVDRSKMVEIRSQSDVGLNVLGGKLVNAGEVIIRQKGTKYYPGLNTELGRDFTIFSVAKGTVNFTRKAARRFDGRRYERVFVNIIPA